MTLRVVTEDKAIDQESPTWRNATPEALLRDEARLGYWRAVMKGNKKRIASALKAWRDLLHVPKTRMTNGS
jgi:hypothetical protein